MNKAYIFQHRLTKTQLFMYWCEDLDKAKFRLSYVVSNPFDWQYIGQKITEDV